MIPGRAVAEGGWVERYKWTREEVVMMRSLVLSVVAFGQGPSGSFWTRFSSALIRKTESRTLGRLECLNMLTSYDRH